MAQLISARDACTDPEMKKVLRYATQRIDDLERQLTRVRLLAEVVVDNAARKES